MAALARPGAAGRAAIHRRATTTSAVASIPKLSCIGVGGRRGSAPSPTPRNVAAAASRSGAACDGQRPSQPKPIRAPSPARNVAAAAASSSSGEPAGDDGGQPPSEQSQKPVREQLARYGLGAFCAYGILSNLNAGVLIVIAWMGVVKKLGVTPLDASHPQAAGAFAAAYAALYLTSNLMRPVRLSLAVGAAPFFNRFLDSVQRSLRLSRPTAFGVMLLMIATGTITTITLALAALGGFPQGVPSPEGLKDLMKGLKEGVKAAKQSAAA
jgi:hypothetical protein